MDAEVKFASLRAGAGGAAVTIYGFTLNEWVALFTILYFVVQIVILMPKFISTIRGWIR